MIQFRLMLPLAPLLIASSVFAADAPGDIARGNMHFDAKAIDANGDNMISKDEFMKYGETMWERMNRSATVSVPIADAARDFARGGLKFDAKAMDANGDGKITKDEFMKYGEAKFDRMKKDPNGMISVADAARDIGSGNMHTESKY
jgi:hypothetical protein